MTGYVSLPELARGAFAAAFTLIVLAAAAAVMLRLCGKKEWKAALIAPFAALSAVVWYASVSLNIAYAKGEELRGLAMLLGSLPWLAVLGILIALAVGAALLLRYAAASSSARAGEYAVLEGLDSMDCGVCFCREDGSVIVMNHAMEELCYELFDHIPTNGRVLKKLLYDREDDDALIRLSDGRIVTANTEEPDDKSVRCMIAREVSEEYRLNESVESADAELEKLSAALRETGREAVSFVTASRGLALREKAFDSLSDALALCAEAADSDDEEKKTSARAALTNALGMFDARASGDDAFAELMGEAAGRLGLSFEVKGSLPRSGELKKAALDAAAGYVTAALKYAPEADHYMEIREGTWVYEIVLSTRARLPQEAVRGMGLDRIAEEAGGNLAVSDENGTELFLRFRLNRTSR